MFLSTEFPGGPRVFASRPASVRVCRGQWGAGQRIPHHNHWNRYFILDWYFIMNSNIVAINVLSTLATAMLSTFYSCVLLLYQLLSHLGFSFLYMILYGKHQLSFLRYERYFYFAWKEMNELSGTVRHDTDVKHAGFLHFLLQTDMGSTLWESMWTVYAVYMTSLCKLSSFWVSQ